MGTTADDTGMPYADDHDDEHGGNKPKYLSSMVRGKANHFYINGDVFFPGKRLLYNPKCFKDLPHYLDFLTEKLEPRFGAVRKIHTPHHGHRIRELEDLQSDKGYVVAGQERFRAFEYDQITSSDRKKSPPFKYDAHPVYHSRQFQASGRINKIETSSILIKVWPNGNDLKGPRRVLITPRVRPYTLPNIMVQVNEILKEDCCGTVEKLYFLNGIKVTEPDQIYRQGEYVACTKHQRFQRMNYCEFGTKNLATSPRLERKFLVPLGGRSNNSTQQSSPEHSTSSKHNSPANGYGQRRRGPPKREEDQVFPARPVKHTRSSEKQADLDADEGGVFKAKQANRNTRGAREVQDTRHTKTDLPVDQREAKEVEEEINGRREDQRPQRNNNGRPQRGGGMMAKPNSKRPPPAAAPKEHPRKRDDLELRRNQSATRIQANYRGYRTRKQLRSRDQHDHETDQAATRIQAGFRGHLARKDMREKEEAATNVQAGYRSHKSRQKVEEDKKQKEEAAKSIQSGYRSHKARKESPKNDNDADRQRAASKIQSEYRRHRSRQNSPGQEEAATTIQSGYRSHRSRNDKRASPSHKEKAAVKIQSSYRGHRVRSDLKSRQAAATNIQSGYRSHRGRQGREPTKQRTNLLDEEDKAATKIQANYRGHIVRRQLRDQKQAASDIQSGYRSYRARSYSPRKAHDDKEDDPFRREDEAAVKIQSGYRGHMARKQYRQMSNQRAADRTPQIDQEDTYDDLDRENDAATKIQSQYRGYRTRKEYKKRRAAAN